MSFNYNSEIFNSYVMNMGSLNFYFSTIILVLMCLLFDLGINRLLLLYGIIADPLKIKAEEYEKKFELFDSKKLEKNKEINNHCKFLFYPFSYWICFFSGNRTNTTINK